MACKFWECNRNCSTMSHSHPISKQCMVRLQPHHFIPILWLDQWVNIFNTQIVTFSLVVSWEHFQSDLRRPTSTGFCERIPVECAPLTHNHTTALLIKTGVTNSFDEQTYNFNEGVQFCSLKTHVLASRQILNCPIWKKNNKCSTIPTTWEDGTFKVQGMFSCGVE